MDHKFEIKGSVKNNKCLIDAIREILWTLESTTFGGKEITGGSIEQGGTGEVLAEWEFVSSTLPNV
jgi:hypothetical protein